MTKKEAGGFTLIELVISIVIIGTVGLSLIGLLAFMSKTSAEGMARTQSLAIASSYLDHVLRQTFSASQNDIDAFDGGVHHGARDANNLVISGLEHYQVSVSVQPRTFNSIPGTRSRLVTVTVTDPLGDIVRLRGFKTRHP